MQMTELIGKKRDGGKLSAAEIDYMIQGYTAGSIPDYQMSAMCMAILLRGMDEEETLNLTLSMVNSGDTLDLSAIKGLKADKHSTGGVGDKTSLVLCPMVAACGVKIAKMSGRGLGHTGGTIDKLESFPGFSTEVSDEQFFKNVNELGIAIIGQTAELVPADKKIYALRDVTATVPSIPLMASSIMSKKLAAGADVIVLDVKCGDGAFMKTEDEARVLAETMTKIGKGAGRKCAAVITDMDQPLGWAIGNALEVKEAISVLRGEAEGDLLELCIALGSCMLTVGGFAPDNDTAAEMLREAIASGKAIKIAAAGLADIDAEKLYLNAHGTGTPLNDKTETRAIKNAFGEDAKKVHISSTKSMTGHMLGAAGAVEAIAAILAVKEDIIPPTINLQEADPDCDLDYTPNTAVRTTVEGALSTSLGFGGHNACVAFRKV